MSTASTATQQFHVLYINDAGHVRRAREAYDDLDDALTAAAATMGSWVQPVYLPRPETVMDSPEEGRTFVRVTQNLTEGTSVALPYAPQSKSPGIAALFNELTQQASRETGVAGDRLYMLVVRARDRVLKLLESGVAEAELVRDPRAMGTAYILGALRGWVLTKTWSAVVDKILAKLPTDDAGE